ncbi:methionine aminotransferase [Brumimicrobium oceani]|uniref:Methionine aminotransferase n=1 Tax=Brumimicrobium oceani TaxID=2100725 RepID=A0A2U2XA17_9FLAO|nr:methionine aminotransferase [Brumimicrobium oceani]PWH84634.1 methionine aminotransferase [Brumimicrobium oceani]
MSEFKSKLPHIGTSVFTVMSKMAAQYNAINLSQGFPNFPVAPELVENYEKVIKGDYHQYMPMPGAPRLLVEISQKIATHYGRIVNPEEEVLVTAGATQAIYTAIQAVIHRGDEAIVLDPSYDCYAPSVELAGGKPIHVNMQADFSVDWNKVEDAISAKTKLLIVNNPHNPGGTVFSEEDIQAIEQIMERHPHIFLLSDEVYEFIHFEEKHISMNTRKTILDRTFIVSSFGKTFHVTGWKIGYLVAPKYLMDEVKKIHQYIVFSVNSTSQMTLSNYLPQADLSQLGEFYQKKRDFFRGLMKNSRFELLDCQGTYFQVARYSEISNLGDVDFATEMTQKHGVAVIPVSGFNKDQHDDHLIRFCFAKDEETIIKATEKLCKI